MSKSINTTGEFYFGVFEEKLTAVYILNERSMAMDDLHTGLMWCLA